MTMHRKTTYRFLTLTAITWLLCGPTVFAQQTGTLKGQILDLSGTGIEWATVTVGMKAQKYESKPDKDGKYELTLPSGTYNLIVRSNGFLSSRKRQVKIIANEVLEIHIIMHTQREYFGCLLSVTENAAEQKGPVKRGK